MPVIHAMSLRWRLTLLSAALLGIALSVIGVVIYLYVQQSSYQLLDAELRDRAGQASSSLNKQALDQLGVGALDLPDTRLDTPTIYLQVLDLRGQVLRQSPNLVNRPPLTVDPASFQTALLRREVVTNATLSNGTTMRVLYAPLTQDLTPLNSGDPDAVVGIVQAASPITPVDRQLGQARLMLLLTILLTLALVSVGVYWTTGRTLGAVDRIATTARRIELSQDLSQRIPDSADAPDDEMTRLVRTFNKMLARLDASFDAQRRFVADSSHELRSPLTVIRGNLELWRRARSDQDREAVITAIEHETARMTRLVENLLFLAQMEAGKAPTAPLAGPVELDSLLLTVFQQARVLGRNHHVTLAHEDVVAVRGDQDLLQQLLLNLVDNAIKYTPAGGTISLGLYGEEQWARLEVADSGIGIPAEDVPHIFDRFYRSDKARSRTVGGAGLGLSIVREVAEAHGGRVEVFSTQGQGTMFRVWLPRLRTATVAPPSVDEEPVEEPAPLRLITPAPNGATPATAPDGAVPGPAGAAGGGIPISGVHHNGATDTAANQPAPVPAGRAGHAAPSGRGMAEDGA